MKTVDVIPNVLEVHTQVSAVYLIALSESTAVFNLEPTNSVISVSFVLCMLGW